MLVFGKSLKYDSLSVDPFSFEYKCFKDFFEKDIYKYFKLNIDQYMHHTVQEQDRMKYFVDKMRELEKRVQEENKQKRNNPDTDYGTEFE